MGQVCRITDQEGNDEYFYYDEKGRRETHIDRNGNVERTLYNMDGSLSYQRFEGRKGRNLYNMDGSLCYQRFQERKGRPPVVNRYAKYPDRTELAQQECQRVVDAGNAIKAFTDSPNAKIL